MGGRPLLPLTLPARAQDDLSALIASALDAVSASALLREALQGGALSIAPADCYTLVAAGKASAAMLERWDALVSTRPARAIGVGTHDQRRVPDHVEWFSGGHPTPTPSSLAAAEAVLAAAAAVPPDGRLVVLLSGGASSLLCSPVSSVSLADKQQLTRALMHDGRAIDELNCVRKHLSRIKGGRLAAACRGRTITLAISDVVAPIEDDPSVIGSGPTVADATTFADAWRVVSNVQARDAIPPSVTAWLQRGLAGQVPDTPKPGDAALARSRFALLGTRHLAMRGAADDARRLGYEVAVLRAPVLGEAPEAGAAHVQTALAAAGARPGPWCIVSSGETTVTVRGTGRGGRNQEFVAGAMAAIAASPRPMLLASVGTDGIDGPTDAAGAWAHSGTLAAAAEQSLDWQALLTANDSYELHRRLGTLLRTGPTDTNVGDVQIVLVY